MSRPRLAITLSALLAVAITLSGCTSDAKKKPAASTSAASTSAATSTGTAVAPATLATTLQKGLSTATSAHLAVSTLLSGQTITGSGSVGLASGAINRADLTQQLPSGLGTIRIVIVGGTTYAKLPSALTKAPAKPWVVLSAPSSSVVVSTLAGTVQPILAVASPASLVAFARSASSVRNLGMATAGGATATHYKILVDATKLPSTLSSSISAGSRTSIPVDMYLDATGRPVQVTGTFSLSGQSVTPTIVLTDYNRTVSISAPPASQISR